jgi:hypothetical protein
MYSCQPCCVAGPRRHSAPSPARRFLLFGVIEAVTLTIGWMPGSVAAYWIEDWNH